MNSPQPAILVADCDPAKHGRLRSLCKKRGWGFKLATNPNDFVRLIDQGGFDLVIADSDMPGLDCKTLFGPAYRRKSSQLLVVVGDSQGGSADLRMLRSKDTDVVLSQVDLDWIERCMDQASYAKRQESKEQLAYSFVVSEETEMRFSCKQLVEAQAITLPVLGRLVASGRLSEGAALSIRVAVQEALLNAFEHGNLELESRWKEEPVGSSDRFSTIRHERLNNPRYADRTVLLTTRFNGEFLKIVVKDEGNGFDPNTLTQIEPDEMACFGRGIKLMRNGVDEVSFACGGTEVTLLKRLN